MLLPGSGRSHKTCQGKEPKDQKDTKYFFFKAFCGEREERVVWGWFTQDMLTGLGFALGCEEAESAWPCSPWFSHKDDCGFFYLSFIFCLSISYKTFVLTVSFAPSVRVAQYLGLERLCNYLC